MSNAVQGTVFESWATPRTHDSSGRRIRRRIDNVEPLPMPIESYPRSTESRKHAVAEGELIDANLVVTLEFQAAEPMDDLVKRAPACLWAMRPAVVMRLSYPRVTCLVFASGKALLVGVRSFAHGLLAAWHAALFLRQIGIRDATVDNFVVRNVTSTTFVGAHVDILKFAENPGPDHDVSLEGDVFPGAVARSKNLGCHITITTFVSGKINVTGSLRASQTEKAINAILARILHYRVFELVLQQLLEVHAAEDRKNRRQRGRELEKLKEEEEHLRREIARHNMVKERERRKIAEREKREAKRALAAITNTARAEPRRRTTAKRSRQTQNVPVPAFIAAH
jgi:TATA-box binding protein (TBP) (component of TFIID and TFIIIB)